MAGAGVGKEEAEGKGEGREGGRTSSLRAMSVNLAWYVASFWRTPSRRWMRGGRSSTRRASMWKCCMLRESECTASQWFVYHVCRASEPSITKSRGVRSSARCTVANARRRSSQRIAIAPGSCSSPQERRD